jgi:hypothetical protein
VVEGCHRTQFLGAEITGINYHESIGQLTDARLHARDQLWRQGVIVAFDVAGFMLFKIMGSMALNWSSVFMVLINSLAATSASEAGNCARTGIIDNDSSTSRPTNRTIAFDMEISSQNSRAIRLYTIRDPATVMGRTRSTRRRCRAFPLAGAAGGDA